jgi:lactoylglutathione lyase
VSEIHILVPSYRPGYPAPAIRRESIARGLSPSRAPFVGNNLWVVSYVDPDGYRIDFESPTDVPEDTEYDPALQDR